MADNLDLVIFIGWLVYINAIVLLFYQRYSKHLVMKSTFSFYIIYILLIVINQGNALIRQPLQWCEESIMEPAQSSNR